MRLKVFNPYLIYTYFLCTSQGNSLFFTVVQSTYAARGLDA
jgi:hypothetical protein